MAITETLQKPMTGDEFLNMPDSWRCELVRGEVVRMSPAGRKHGQLSIWIGTLLTNFVKPRKLGATYAAETGVYIQHNPDTVRAPDAMFISNEREAQISDPYKFIDVAPDLVVEVLSPNDTWTEVETKVDEFLSAGVRLIWVVDPQQETITIYNSDGTRIRLTKADTLTGHDVLPDFSVSVSDIFDL